MAFIYKRAGKYTIDNLYAKLVSAFAIELSVLLRWSYLSFSGSLIETHTHTHKAVNELAHGI